MTAPTLPAEGSEPGDTEDSHGNVLSLDGAQIGPDPSNTPVEELVAPLEPDDDVLTLVNTEATEVDGGASQ